MMGPGHTERDPLTLLRCGLSSGQVIASVGWACQLPDLGLVQGVRPKRLVVPVHLSLAMEPSERPCINWRHEQLRRVPRHAKLAALEALGSFLGLW